MLNRRCSAAVVHGRWSAVTLGLGMAGVLLVTSACGLIGSAGTASKTSNAKVSVAAPSSSSSSSSSSSASSSSPHSASASASSPSSSPQSTSASTWAPVVTMALSGVAALSSVPLEGPVNPSGCVGGVSAGSPCWTAAWYQANAASYWVHVGQCPAVHTAGESEHQVGQAVCNQSIAVLVTGYDFGGILYASSAQARQTVALPAPAGTPVDLGSGITGASNSPGVIAWTEGQWHFAVNYGTCPAATSPQQQAQTTAATIVAYLHTHLLPETAGSLAFGASCGDVSSALTTLEWVWDRTVYSVSVIGYQPLAAVRLAIAMEPRS